MPRKAQRVRVERGLYRAGKTYIACATPPGSRRPRWRTLGEVGIMQARRLRDEFAYEVRRGEIRAAASRATVAEVAGAWVEHQRRLVAIGELAPRTLDSYESAVRLHIVPALGSRRVASIVPDDLVAWHRDQRALGASPWSIRARWVPLRALFAHAARYGHITSNPADRLTRRERPGPGESRQRFLTREEMEALLEHSPRRYHPAIATALFSGLRVAELCGLVWEDVDFAGEQLLVRYQMSRKGRRVRLKSAAGRREVVLMPSLARILRAHRLASVRSGEADLVFATVRGTTIGDRNLATRGLDRACEDAGLQEVTFHALRHTFASLLIAQGRDPAFVSAQLGHANPAITLQTYTHLFDAARHAREAREELDAEYGPLLRRGASKGASNSGT